MTSTAIFYLLITSVFACMVRRPSIALAMVLVQFGLEQWAQGKGGLLAIHPWLSNVFIGCLVVAGLLILFLKNRVVIKSPPHAWLVYLLLMLSLASYFWASDRLDFVEVWWKYAPYIIVNVLLAPLLISSWSDLRSALYGILVVGSLVLVLLAFDVERSGRLIIIQGNKSGGNPLAVASLAGHAILVATLLNFRGLGRVWQFARWGVIGIGLYVIVLSESRGQFFGAIIAAAIFLPMSRKIGSVRGFIVGGIGLLGIVIIGYFLQQQFAMDDRWGLSTMGETFGETRLGTSFEMLEIWFNAGAFTWFLGLGSSASYGVLGIYPHMVTIEVLTEEGIIGFTLWCLFLALTARAIWSCYRVVREDAAWRGVLAAVSALFVFECIMSCKQGSFLSSQLLLMFGIIIGRLEMMACLPRHPQVLLMESS